MRVSRDCEVLTKDEGILELPNTDDVAGSPLEHFEHEVVVYREPDMPKI